MKTNPKILWVLGLMIVLFLYFVSKSLIEVNNSPNRYERKTIAVERGLLDTYESLTDIILNKHVLSDGHFSILIPDKDIKKRKEVEKLNGKIFTVHKTYQSISEEMRTFVSITESFFYQDISQLLKVKCIEAIFKDLTTRPNAAKMELLEKEKFKFFKVDIGYNYLLKGKIYDKSIKNSYENFYYISAFFVESKMYVIKVMTPSKKVSKKIINSFELLK